MIAHVWLSKSGRLVVFTELSGFLMSVEGVFGLDYVFMDYKRVAEQLKDRLMVPLGEL